MCVFVVVVFMRKGGGGGLVYVQGWMGSECF